MAARKKKEFFLNIQNLEINSTKKMNEEKEREKQLQVFCQD